MSEAVWRRSRSYRLTGLVIHHRDMGEADRVITVLTPDRGRVSLLAKGVRKITSRKAGHLDLFVHVRLQVVKGRTWDIVTQAEALRTFPHIRENVRRAAHAYYVAELLYHLSPEEQGDTALFDLALEALEYVDTAPNLLVVSRWFEAHALRITGFSPQLYICPLCGAPLPVDRVNYWVPSAGGTVCPSCGATQKSPRPLAPRVLKLMRFLHTHTYERIRELPLSTELLLELERYMHAYLRHILERDLRSLAFLRRLRKVWTEGGYGGEWEGKSEETEMV